MLREIREKFNEIYSKKRLIGISIFNRNKLNEVYKIRKQEFTYYINEKLPANESLNGVIEYYKLLVRQTKNNTIIGKGVATAITLPLWDNLVERVYEFSNNVTEVILATLMLSILAVSIIVIIMNFQIFFEDFVYGKINKIENMIYYLEEIYTERKIEESNLKFNVKFNNKFRKGIGYNPTFVEKYYIKL